MTPIQIVATAIFSLVTSLLSKNSIAKSTDHNMICLTKAIEPIIINKIPNAVVGFLPRR